MAKKLTTKQKKIAGAAAPKNAITGADFKALRSKGSSKALGKKQSMPRKKGM